MQPHPARAAFLLLITSGFLWAQSAAPTRPSAKDPIELLPAESAVYLRVSGHEQLRAALEQTAAYRSMHDSGLAELLLPLAGRALAEGLETDRSSDEVRATSDALSAILEHVWRHGLVAGIDVKLFVGEGVFVFPHGAKGPLEANIETLARLYARRHGLPIRREVLESRQVATLPAEPFVLSWWEEGSHLVLVGSLIGPGATLRRLEGREEGFSKARRDARLGPARGTAIAAEIWLDVEAMVRSFPRVEPIPKVMSLMGVEGLRGITVVWYCDGPALRTETEILLPAPRRGLFQAVDTSAVSPDRLPKLPADTDSVMFFPFDGRHLYDVVLPAAGEWVRAFTPPDSESLREQLHALDQVLGWKMRDDFLAHLGPTGVLYDAPADGIVGVGGYSVALAVRDRPRLKTAMDQLSRRVSELDPRWHIEARRVEDADLWLITPQGAPLPITPTVALTDAWLTIGLVSPAQALRFVRLQRGQGPAWKMPPALLEKVRGAEGTLLAFGHSDPKPTVRALLSLLPLALGAAKAKYPGMEIDLTRLPDPDRVMAPLFPSTTVVTMDQRGVHIVQTSSLPIPGLGPDTGTLTTGGILSASFLFPRWVQAASLPRRSGPMLKGN